MHPVQVQGSGLGTSQTVPETVTDEERIWGWGEILRPVSDMKGRTGPGHIQGETSKRLLFRGARDFSGEKCRAGDRAMKTAEPRQEPKPKQTRGHGEREGSV